MKPESSAPPHQPHISGLAVKVDREEDGRCLAEVPVMPGVMVYGEGEAVARVEGLALRVLAERLERGEQAPEVAGFFRAA